MFTYIDSRVRARLIADGKLIRIDATGRVLGGDEHLPEEAMVLNLLGPVPLPMQIGDEHIQADWFASVRRTELRQVEQLAKDLVQQGGQQYFSSLASSMAVNSVLVIGQPGNRKAPLVRVHSSCLTGDVFGSRRCECGPQLDAALTQIAADPAGGLLIYMAGHEGRGIGLWAKAATYLLQDSGEDTYGANRALGLPDDSRDFSEAAALIRHFIGDRRFRLLTNNPKKLQDLADNGLNDIEAVPHVIGVSDFNRRYLEAKRDWGHRLSDDDLTD